MENQTTLSVDDEIALIEASAKAILAGESLAEDTLYALADIQTAPARKLLLERAEEITKALCPPVFDSCSIVNARSGSCSENCKWCAQSAHFSTGCQSYTIIDRKEALDIARYNAARGVRRFSLVASGRAVRGKALDQMCSILREAKDTCGISTCASMGLLTKEELQQLWNNGVHRYHCNLETAPSFFHTLCTTHTVEDKLATIRAALEIGFEVCSGGIIGMGETMRQRMELAITLRQVRPASIPINVLSPIAGTPLAEVPLISEDDILATIALFRFAHPAVQLRFAGGRGRMSRKSKLQAMRIGINGGVVGDLLTTVGSTIADDRELATEAGYEW